MTRLVADTSTPWISWRATDPTMDSILRGIAEAQRGEGREVSDDELREDDR